MAMDREAGKRTVEQAKTHNGLKQVEKRLLQQILNEYKYVAMTVLVGRVKVFLCQPKGVRASEGVTSTNF
jgi:hypothetical protein